MPSRYLQLNSKTIDSLWNRAWHLWNKTSQRWCYEVVWDCDYHPALDVNYAKIEWFYDHQSMVKLSFYLGIYGCKWSLIVLYGSKYLYQIGYNRVLISFSLQPSWALLKTPVKSEQCIYPKDFYLSLKQFIKVHTIIIDCKLIVTDNHFVLLSFKCILKQL